MTWYRVGRRPRLAWPGLLLLVTLTACSSAVAPTPPAHVTRMAAPASALPMLQALVAAYEKQTSQPAIFFDVHTAASQLAVEALQNGQTDLAVTSWLTTTDLPGLAVTPIAWDAAAVIVHPRNPITDVTLLQLRDLFRGHTLDWSAFGGGDGEITAISREDGSGVRAAFEQAVMGGQPVTLGAVVLPNDAAVIDAVQNRPTAVGYVSLLGLQAAQRAAEQPVEVKTLRVEGVVPDSSNLVRGGYHLVHPLYLLARRPISASLRSFIDFVLSPAGQAVVTRYTTGVR